MKREICKEYPHETYAHTRSQNSHLNIREQKKIFKTMAMHTQI